MLFALVHLVLRRLFGFAGGSESQSQSKDVEILILRHQLQVKGAFIQIMPLTRDSLLLLVTYRHPGLTI